VDLERTPAASLAGFTLVVVARRLDPIRIAAVLPDRPGRTALAIYLFAVATALTLAWLPDMASAAITGRIAAKVDPYTSSVTDALDLGVGSADDDRRDHRQDVDLRRSYPGCRWTADPDCLGSTSTGTRRNHELIMINRTLAIL
jgi:hypothetical protein